MDTEHTSSTDVDSEVAVFDDALLEKNITNLVVFIPNCYPKLLLGINKISDETSNALFLHTDANYNLISVLLQCLY